jgi:hypothetical protein
MVSPHDTPAMAHPIATKTAMDNRLARLALRYSKAGMLMTFVWYDLGRVYENICGVISP